MKVKVQRHKAINGSPIFTISLPLQCACGYHFTRRLQVGVNNPIVPCPLCYRRNLLKLTWKLKKRKLKDGDFVEVIMGSGLNI
ncbi:hypothetical protein J7M02_07270 [Candidatus Aerophobetes bacterium]|nr:hypothetical protein [Candidatus Aerophobetes bacterium]